MEPRNLVGHGKILFLSGAKHHVRIFQAAHRLVGGNDHDLELVDVLEFRGLCFRRAGHAGELLIQAEIILEGDGGQRLVFAANVHLLLGLDRLVQSIAPAAARHQAAGKLVHDDDFAILHHVGHIAPVERVGLDRNLDVML